MEVRLTGLMQRIHLSNLKVEPVNYFEPFEDLNQMVPLEALDGTTSTKEYHSNLYVLEVSVLSAPIRPTYAKLCSLVLSLSACP